MPSADSRVDPRKVLDDDGHPEGFIWVLQAVNPVEDLCSSLPKVFASGHEAIEHFKHTSRRMGWKNLTVEGE